MHTRLLGLVSILPAAALGCGGGGGTDAPPGGIDAPPGAIDGPRPDALASTCTPRSGTTVTARLVTGATSGAPMMVTSPPGDARAFEVERNGRIRILNGGVLSNGTFLDISGLITGGSGTGNEQGLLGLVFHPDYAVNRKFYVFYTGNDGGNADILAEYTTEAGNPDRADPASARIILSIPDFASNHNGGMMHFGADGYLYVGTGDGGGAGDPQENGQDTNALLAKILRIDVDQPSGTNNYGIPPGNPFVAGGGAPEVFLYGVRNPWRWTFDTNGDLYIADVGQGLWEEVDYLTAAQAIGSNLGWDQYEGNGHCFEGPCDPAGKTSPVTEYSHGDGYCAIIGGAVYRGGCFPDLVGTYFFTDYCKHELQSFKISGGTPTGETAVGGFPGSPTSISTDAYGEMYYTTETGDIYALEVQ